MDQTEGRMMSIHNLATERIVVWPVSLLRKGKFLLSKVIHVHHFKMSNRENYKNNKIKSSHCSYQHISITILIYVFPILFLCVHAYFLFCIYLPCPKPRIQPMPPAVLTAGLPGKSPCIYLFLNKN